MTKPTPVSTKTLTEQRVDTWLWAARFFKTRALASAAIEGGKITLNQQACKKSGKVVRVGDTLEIERGDTRWVIEITGLSKQRGSATLAQTLYSESPTALAERLKKAEQHHQERVQNPTLAKPDQHTRILLRALRRKPI
ncbi:MAG: RNA-binding S4 domain-containing protein [Halothiobacillus sp.]